MLLQAVILIVLIFMIAEFLFYRYIINRRLHYTRFFSKRRAYAGETVYLMETVSNAKRIPVPMLRIESTMPAFLKLTKWENLSINEGRIIQNHRSIFAVPAYTEIVRKHEILCAGRGVYDMKSVAMTAGEMIGFPVRQWEQPMDGKFCVFPGLLPVRELPVNVQNWMESELSTRDAFMENHYQVSGVRPYLPGDSWRRINWKATAKTGQILVQTRETIVNDKLWICLNIQDRIDMWKNVSEVLAIEKLIQISATIAQAAINSGMRVGFLCNAVLPEDKARWVHVPSGGGHEHLERMLEVMAALQLSSRIHFYELLEQAESMLGQARVVLLGAVIDPEARKRIDRLRRQGCAASVLEFPIKKRQVVPDEEGIR